MSDESAEERTLTILEKVIIREVPSATDAYVEDGFAFVLVESGQVWRFRLSPDAQRVDLLEREGRYRDIQPGPVMLLPVLSDETA